MFLKKLFLLLSGYIAGSVVSSLYTNKKGKDLKVSISKAKKTGENDKKILIDNIIETQKNFILDLERIFFTEENKKYINEKKEKLVEIVDNYKAEGEELLTTLKEGGKDKEKKIKEQLLKLYNEKSELIDNLKGFSPELTEKFKTKLVSYLDTLKKKIK